MESNSGGAVYSLARGTSPELANLSVWELARVAVTATGLLILRLLRLAPRVTWPVAQAWVSCDHWLQYRAQVQAMAQLDNHLRDDMGMPHLAKTYDPIPYWYSQ
jgi:uncharacterized protein YjiS (DUF1127 family)